MTANSFHRHTMFLILLFSHSHDLSVTIYFPLSISLSCPFSSLSLIPPSVVSLHLLLSVIFLSFSLRLSPILSTFLPLLSVFSPPFSLCFLLHKCKPGSWSAPRGHVTLARSGDPSRDKRGERERSRGVWQKNSERGQGGTERDGE